MSAAARHKATLPLEPFSGPGAVPQYATEAALRTAQARECVGRYVAFTHGQRGPLAGMCVACEPAGKVNGIPDFGVSVRSLRDPANRCEVNAVANRCQFFDTAAEAVEFAERRAK